MTMLTIISTVDHKTVLHLMSISRTLLSLSLEQAGFFSFEAAASGCVVLCLPNSGGSMLPDAVLLAEDNEQVSLDLLVARCKTARLRQRAYHSSQTASKSRQKQGKHIKLPKPFSIKISDDIAALLGAPEPVVALNLMGLSLLSDKDFNN